MKTKKDKEKLLEELKEKFGKSLGFIIVNLMKLKGNDQFIIKEILKKEGGLFQVPKKTLIYKANPNFPLKDEELKTSFAFIWEFNQDLSAFKALKIIKEKGIEIEVLKGYLEGRVLNQKEILELSELPSKEELISKLISYLKNPLYRLAFVLSFPLKKLALNLSSINKK